MTVPYSWTVYVRLRDQAGNSPPSQAISRIRSYESYGDTMQDLSDAGMAPNGICTLYFGREKFYPPRTRPTLTIEVYAPGEILLDSQEFAEVENLSTIEFVIGCTQPQEWHVLGNVTADAGPVTGGTVTLYDVIGEVETPIKTDPLDSSGHYDVTFTNLDFSQTSTHLAPNLKVRVSTPLGEGASNTYNNAPCELTVNIHIPEVVYDWTVSGSVYRTCEGLVTSGRVEALDFYNENLTPLGEDDLDEQGQYHIGFFDEDFGKSDLHPKPHLIMRVYDAGNTLLVQTPPRFNAAQHETIDIFLEGDNSQCDRCVRGTITNTLGLPVSSVHLEVYQVALVDGAFHEQKIGEDDPKNDGTYIIYFNDAQIIDPQENGCCAEPCSVSIYVLVRKEGIEVTRSALLCNATDCPEINIVVDLPSDFTDSEYQRLHDAMYPCVGDPMSDETLGALNDSPEKRAMISCQIKWGVSYIFAYVRAHHILGEINVKVPIIDPDTTYSGNLPVQFLYALIRRNKGETIDELVSLDIDVAYTAFIDAIHAGTVSNIFQDSLSSIMEDWKAIVLAFLLNNNTSQAPITWQNELLTIAAPECERPYVLEVYFSHQGPLYLFYEALREHPQISESTATDVEFAFDTYELVYHWIPLVRNIFAFTGKYQWHTVEELAIVGIHNRPHPDYAGGYIEGWTTFISNAWATVSSDPLPGDIPSGTKEEQIEILATRIFNRLNDKMPDEHFTVALSEMDDLDPVMTLAYDFIVAYPTYDLANDHIDAFSDANGIDPDEATRDAVKELQRLYHLTTDAEAVVALHDAGFHSAFEISQMDEAKFVADYESIVGGLTQATRIHRAAVSLSKEILFLLGRFNQTINAAGSGGALPDTVNLQAVAAQTLGAAGDGALKTLPNWITLFGDFNRCTSEHCETVFSPSAYLVDLLEFIGGGAKETLFERRPDLTEIELTCPNTNRVMPYIDLVNEILEEVVSPLMYTRANPGGVEVVDRDAGVTPVDMSWEIVGELVGKGVEITAESTARSIEYEGDPEVPIRWVIEAPVWRVTVFDDDEGAYTVHPTPQTSAGDESLEVYPEHIHHGAYGILKDSVFPFSLPFDLAREEIAILLGYKKTPRHALLEAFNGDALAAKLGDEEIALAYLNLGQDDLETLRHVKTGLADWEYWGFSTDILSDIPRPDKPTEGESGHWTFILSMMPYFMHRTGLSYQEVLDLIDTQYVSAANEEGEELYIYADSEDAQLCNINEYRIGNLGASALNLISTFVRLWRKTGWTMRELDRYLMDFSPPERPPAPSVPIDVDAVSLHHVQRLHKELKVPVLTVLSWWRDMDTRRSVRVPKPLYDEVYLVGNRDEDQYKALEAHQPIVLLNKETIPDPDYAPILRAALNVNEDDYALLAEKEGSTADEVIFEGGVHELTKMYRTATFCKATKLSIKDYYRLKEVLKDPSGPDNEIPFDPYLGGLPVNTFTSLENLDKLKRHKISAGALDFMLRHHFEEGDAWLPKPQDVADLVIKLGQERKDLLEAKLGDTEAETEEKDPARIVEDVLSQSMKLDQNITSALLNTTLDALVNQGERAMADWKAILAGGWLRTSIVKDLGSGDEEVHSREFDEVLDVDLGGIPAGVNKIVWTTYLEVPADGGYYFTIGGDVVGAEWFTINGAPQPLNDEISLKAKTVYELGIRWEHTSASGVLQLLWSLGEAGRSHPDSCHDPEGGR